MSDDLYERQQEAARIRDWIASIYGVLESAQRIPDANTYLGMAASTLEEEADKLWPRPSWESSDPPGPPTSARVDVKAHSHYVVPDSSVDGPSVEIVLSVTERYGHSGAVRIPLRAVQATIDALGEHLLYWDADV